MDRPDFFTTEFEAQRTRLRSVAYRMLGSLSEAEDAVQDTWLRASGTDRSKVENLTAWLTTIVARTSLNALRTRTRLREDPLEYAMPDPIVGIAAGGPASSPAGREHGRASGIPSGSGFPRPEAGDPEGQAILSDHVGMALQVVLESLDPDERLAFVLHDLFAVPFNDIAPVIASTPEAARQLASRARRRVRSQAPAPDAGLAAQREVVDAFFAAARNGDLGALIAILHPDAVFRASGLTAKPLVLRGGPTVAGNAHMFGPGSPPYRHVVVNGAAGVITAQDGHVVSITAFTVVGGRVFAVDVLADPLRLAALNLADAG
ncbi:RNA polymerase sigma-70 factor (ECF subfamily) [Arthrobacter stackebrandtii]|uniref:RNA polymerase sigma-70 factor (ECF subfamily) n=1 Tax=Arthrobacter stackebrandtii TaxID=272161 RepID=A0ABS4Z0C5_9MICC|nr:sigma-70 family RNA polymerase sigma factor [Arthrobacter stackebrandtii]MBP2414502.1 RNA polymerase sigma-70 factor (ECF subfamily) [Arthrobacter stackebrandtii]PYH01622.1 RNA polymerase subunit sigma-70 [Arthrobacter stackebrandtii]